jgi:hypothetical protein
VSTGKGALRGLEQGVHVHECDIAAYEARCFDDTLVPTPGIDDTENGGMACSDRRPPAEVLTADGDEVGVTREGSSERCAVHGVPGGLELANNAFDHGSVTWR